MIRRQPWLQLDNGAGPNDPPTWFNFIDEKLTESNCHVREGERRNFVNQLGDENLFFERFFKGQSSSKDLDEIKKEVRDIYAGILQNENVMGMNIEEAVEEEVLRVEDLRQRAANGDGELPISIFFSEGNPYFNNVVGRAFARWGGFRQGWVIHAGLDIGGTTVEWGAGPCGSSLVFPRISSRTILAKIKLHRKSLFDHFINFFYHPIETLIVLFNAISRYFLHFLGFANRSSLFKIAEVSTHYNRSHKWDPISCNCQKFVIDVLERLGLKFAPEGEMKAFIDRINAGYYELSIMSPDGQKFVFESVAALDEFAMVRWKHLPPWSKYLLVTYNNLISERAQKDTQDAAKRNGSPWVRQSGDIQENEAAWRAREEEVSRRLMN